MNSGELSVYKTGLPWEAEMVSGALEQAGIPHYRRVDSLGLGEVAMPAMPAAGPGELFLVIVPDKAAEEARALIGALPVTPVGEQDQGVWTFRPTERVKRGFQIYVWIALGIVAIGILFNAIETFIQLSNRF